jgi:hypothetical protein
MSEGSLAEGEDLARGDTEDERLPAGVVVESAVARLVLPATVPLGRPGFGELGKDVIVGLALRFAFDDHIKPLVPAVAAGRDDHVPVGVQVDGLCSVAPVENHSAPSNQTATSGLTCGLPSCRTVVIHDSSAVLRTCRVVCQGVAADPGSLNRVSRLVAGSLICCSLLVGRVNDEVVDTGRGGEVADAAPIAHHRDGGAAADVGKRC